MPELTVTVRVPLPKQPTLACLEQAVFKALQPAGRELLLEAFGLLEQQTLDGAKQRRRRRYLITRFGEIRFFRWQTRTEAGYGYPLDEALGIGSGDPCSPWVRQTASWLAQAHPFRQAARLLSKMIGTRVDHRTLWGWVQGSGRAVRRHMEQLRASLFDDGEDPAFQGRAPKIVSTSADGTFIRTRDGPVEVKLGIWWTGAHLQSPTASHPRYLLQGKGSYASTQGHDLFGQTFYALAARRAGIAKAQEVFFISDGAGWLADLPADWIAPTAFQLDQFHGKLRISEVAKGSRAGGPLVGMGDRAQPGCARSVHRCAHALGSGRARGRSRADELPGQRLRGVPDVPAPAGARTLTPDGTAGIRGDGAQRRSRGGSPVQAPGHEGLDASGR